MQSKAKMRLSELPEMRGGRCYTEASLSPVSHLSIPRRPRRSRLLQAGLMKDHGQQARASEHFAVPVDFETPRLLKV